MIVRYQGVGWGGRGGGGGQKYVVVVAIQLALGSLKRQFSLHVAVYICRASTHVYVREQVYRTRGCALRPAPPCKRFLQH